MNKKDVMQFIFYISFIPVCVLLAIIQAWAMGAFDE
jgi:hypothetical protein